MPSYSRVVTRRSAITAGDHLALGMGPVNAQPGSKKYSKAELLMEPAKVSNMSALGMTFEVAQSAMDMRISNPIHE